MKGIRPATLYTVNPCASKADRFGPQSATAVLGFPKRTGWCGHANRLSSGHFLPGAVPCVLRLKPKRNLDVESCQEQLRKGGCAGAKLMRSPQQPAAHTILIVDQDFGFVMWLGHTLALKGYLTLPGTNAREALRLIVDLEIAVVDLVIIDPALPEISLLVDALRGQQADLKVIWIQDSGRRATDIQETHSQWIANVREALEKNKAAGGR